MKHKYTIEQVTEAVNTSFSIRAVLIKLGVAPQGGNYKIVYNLCSKYNISIAHFTGQGHSKGKTLPPKRLIDDYLSNKFPIQSDKLRKRLLKEGIFKPVCSSCLNETWMNVPIPLELEHKDGNHNNNHLSNLCLLCPNCHALTSTYRGKNK